jgi:hypothetical protein
MRDKPDWYLQRISDGRPESGVTQSPAGDVAELFVNRRTPVLRVVRPLDGQLWA